MFCEVGIIIKDNPLATITIEVTEHRDRLGYLKGITELICSSINNESTTASNPFVVISRTGRVEFWKDDKFVCCRLGSGMPTLSFELGSSLTHDLLRSVLV